MVGSRPSSWTIILCMLIGITFTSYSVDCYNEPCYYRLFLDNDFKMLYEYTCQNYVKFYVEHDPILQHFQSFKITVKEPRITNLILPDFKEYDVYLTLQDGNFTTIPDQTLLSKMPSLNSLTITGNKINTINFKSFSQFKKLIKVNLSNNLISVIDTEISNYTTKINVIDISYNDIKVLPNRFLTKFNELLDLNMTHNKISNIGVFTFEGLIQLKTLDLSHNNLHEIGYAFAKLPNLRELYLSNNNVTNLYDNDFLTLTNLEKLDISSNRISAMESETFISVASLEYLHLGNNELNTYLNSNNDDIAFPNNLAFANISSLKTLNISSNGIQNIPSSAFVYLEYIEVLDLSNNQLKGLDLEISTNLSKLYVHHNNIEKINEKIFDKVFLQELDLSHNNIKEIKPRQFLNEFLNLDLSFNIDLSMKSNIFQNASQLKKLSLQNVKTNFNFKDSSASIEMLELQSCSIVDINKLFLFNIQNVTYLNLSLNEITTVDKDSFKNMSTLVILDLSYNKINNIQPGSFLHVNNLTYLNLYANDISVIQFGTFKGLKVLNHLNLSRNSLRTFVFKMLPTIKKLSLDDNAITDLNFQDFLNTGISELSLKGNKISCSSLAEFNNTEQLSRKITKSLSFYTENINGIQCTSIPTEIDQNVLINKFYTNVSALINTLGNRIENISLSLQNFGNEITKTEENLESFKKDTSKNLTSINNQLMDIKKFMLKTSETELSSVNVELPKK